jgi:lysophospholipase L1-like esterase
VTLGQACVAVKEILGSPELCCRRPPSELTLARMKLSPLLLLSALLTVCPWLVAAGAETNHDYAKWEKEIAAFEQLDRTSPPPKGVLLFTGSSTVRLWKTLAQDFPQQRVINRGFGGSEIMDATHFAERIIFPYAPRTVFLRAGGNDLWAGKSPEKVFANFKAFVEKVHAKLPETEIVYISLCPSLARWSQHEKEKTLNTMVEEYIRRTPHLRYVETYDMVLGPDGQPRPELFVADKLHFSPAGYKLLAERVRACLPK